MLRRRGKALDRTARSRSGIYNNLVGIADCTRQVAELIGTRFHARIYSREIALRMA